MSLTEGKQKTVSTKNVEIPDKKEQAFDGEINLSAIRKTEQRHSTLF